MVPTYDPGDFVKIELSDSTTGIGEWAWLIVDHCDDEKQLLFGRLDNEPVDDQAGKLRLGSELAVSYSKIREHRKPWEFKPN